MNMMEKRTTKEIVAAIVFMTIFAVTVGVVSDDGESYVITDPDYQPYACGLESVKDMFCFKLSKLNADGIQSRCYYNKEASRKYKNCNVGWNLIEEEIKEVIKIVTISPDMLINVESQVCNVDPHTCVSI